MEKEKQAVMVCKKPPESDYVLQWGSRKRNRQLRVRSPSAADPSTGGGRVRRKLTSKSFITAEKQSMVLQSTRRNSDTGALRSENGKSASPEKEDRYYTTRGSAAGLDEIGKALMEGGDRGFGGDERRGGGGVVWPKLYISLSSKEKEEDFLAMKGCKPPQRPKKRAKLIQRTLLLVSPGAWLSDMCQERYEVREKKSSKKQRPRGLKAMGSMESDSE